MLGGRHLPAGRPTAGEAPEARVALVLQEGRRLPCAAAACSTACILQCHT